MNFALSPQDVFVLAARHDTENRRVHKTALCALDTGNLQGNFVSRQLVERLGYSELDIRELREDEKREAVGITNDKLVFPLSPTSLEDSNIIQDSRRRYILNVVSSKGNQSFSQYALPHLAASPCRSHHRRAIHTEV